MPSSGSSDIREKEKENFNFVVEDTSPKYEVQGTSALLRLTKSCGEPARKSPPQKKHGSSTTDGRIFHRLYEHGMRSMSVKEQRKVRVAARW